MPRALLSVSNKTGITEFARGLAARGFELVSTGGTARALADAGLAVVGVSNLTGFPEMMDGRVKTLHPAIHGGILARRDRPDDLAGLERLGIGLVDLVVVNLYPFEAAAANPATPFDALIEEIDIGGPSLVRAAAKNFRDVLVVVDPADYPRVIAALDDTAPGLGFRFDLARKAIAHTAAYDAAIAGTLAGVTLDGATFERRSPSGGGTFGARLDVSVAKVRDLRYGENPHQRAAWFAGIGPGGVGFATAAILQGKELSYTNLLDLDAAARMVLEFDEPAAIVVKHTNPCGAAIGSSPADAYVRAREADPLSAFGGIVALNRAIDLATAEAIASTRIDAVIAPAVDDGARAVLARRKDMRVVTADFSMLRGGDAGAPGVDGRGAGAPGVGGRGAGAPGVDFDVRSILGGLLVQDRDRVVEARAPWGPAAPDGFRVATTRQPTPEEWRAMRFAWRICAHVKSNTVIFTDAQRTLAVGAGQMSRVDAVHVAVMKARESGRSLAGSVAASDAFIPFRDGLDAIAAAGATAVVQTGGSVKDAEVIAAADEHGLAMVLTGTRHFRH